MKAPLLCPQSVEELDQLASEPDRGVVEALDRCEGDLLVAGAGGKMGFHLALMLRRALDVLGSARRVVAVSRFGEAAARAPFEAAGIETLSADLSDPAAVAGLPEAGAVFFLEGKKFGTAASPGELRRFNEEMPALVAERFADAKIVALSTGCVYPFVSPKSGGSREDDERILKWVRLREAGFSPAHIAGLFGVKSDTVRRAVDTVMRALDADRT